MSIISSGRVDTTVATGNVFVQDEGDRSVEMILRCIADGSELIG